MLLERLRRPRWRHPKAAVRRHAAQHLAPADTTHAEILEGLARDDTDAGVRAAAVKRVNDAAFLRERLGKEPTATVGEAARARYRQLLAGGDVSASLASRLAELHKCQDAQVLAHVARSGREERMRAAALAQLGDTAVLQESALNDDLARIRQLAVTRIQDSAVLLRIAQRARHSDARIARLARQRATELRQRQDAQQARARAAGAVVADAENLVASGTDNALAAARERLNNRWHAVSSDAPQALRQRFEAADAELRERQRSPVSAAPHSDEDRVATAVQCLEAQTQPAHESLVALHAAVGEVSSERLGARAEMWFGAAARYLEGVEALQVARAADDRTSLAAALSAIDWPEGLRAPPDVAAARALMAASDSYSETGNKDSVDSPQPSPDAAAPSRTELDAVLRRAEAALDHGELREARQLARDLRDLGRGQRLPKDVERQLQRLSARIAELRDWRQFAVAPKQAELCNVMEALATEPTEAPAERAERIRELRDAWKATGGTDSTEARERWARFQAAAEKAFEPCRAWYAEEAERRRRNLETRRQLVEQLEAFMSRSEVTELAASELRRIRSTARRDWQRSAPVDGKALQPLAARFEPLMDRLTELIEGERENARQAKEALCGEVEALAPVAVEDAEGAARQAKALQQRWKAVGAARPGQERALWKRFRAGCDVVFARRDEARDTRRNREQEQLAQAESLCTTLEDLADQDLPPETLQAELDRTAAVFVGQRLPDGSPARALRARYKRALQAAQQRVVVLRARADQALWRAIAAAAEHGEEPPTAAPRAVAQALAARRERGGEARDEAEARELCVQAEVLGNVDTPAADHERRLGLRMAHLGAAFEQGRGRAGPSDIWELIAEWVATPIADAELTQRFDAAVMAAISRDGRS